MKIVNIAAYKFVTLSKDVILNLKEQLWEKAFIYHLRGTILLSAEGINLMIAGCYESIKKYKQFLSSKTIFNDLSYKESLSASCPFSKLVVRVKKEIITMRYPDINPEQETAWHLPPEIFNQWYEKKQEMLVLDTRNHFEFEMGTFTDAIDLGLNSFSDFPKAVNQLSKSLKERLIITFCTSGIRCEKASTLMLKRGFKKVCQLEGGIFNYFEKCGGKYFKGKCFVFDNRISVDSAFQRSIYKVGLD